MEQKKNSLDVEQSALKGWLFAILALIGGAVFFGLLISLNGTIYWYVTFVFPMLAMYLFFRYNRKQAVLGSIVITILAVILNIVGMVLSLTLFTLAEAGASSTEFGLCLSATLSVLFGSYIHYAIFTVIGSLVGAGFGIGYGVSLIKQVQRRQQALAEQAQAEQARQAQAEQEAQTKTEKSEQKVDDANSIIDRVKAKKDNE